MLDRHEERPAPAPFDYGTAFGRTRGWVTAEEQEKLRTTRVAIAGLGGVGGAHLITLLRLGIGHFHIADPDTFELENFNRQVGATVPALGRPKVDVMAAMARDIHPDVEIRSFGAGVGAGNVDAFLEGVDLYIDSLDLFAMEARRVVFQRCTSRGIAALTAAPLGMGTALLAFVPGRTSFEDYFRLEGHAPDEQLLRFVMGLAPHVLHRTYLLHPGAFSIRERRAPSTPMAVHLCSGLAATYALKLLLGRGPVLAAPWGLHFDAYRNRLRRTWRPGGNANPFQRLLLHFARPRLLGDTHPT